MPVTPPSGGTVTVAGNAPTPPTLAISISAAGSGGATLTITNTTTGKSFTLTPGASASPRVLCGLARVENGSGVDITEVFTSGSFFDLAPGANVLTFATTGGLTLSSVAVTHKPRWW